MLLSLLAHPVARISMQRPKTIGKGISRPRIRRVVEGISLWLAVLLMLFVHPLYAEAGPMDLAQPGQLCLSTMVLQACPVYALAQKDSFAAL
ncbi:MAG: hypothetical protein R6T87_07140 [Marinobacter sp.]